MRIRDERSEDFDAIDAVLEHAFGGRVESNLVVSLRSGGYAPIALVATVDGAIVAHIMFCRLKVVRPTGTTDALGLAPLAVDPSFQRQGIGAALVNAGLERVRNSGESIVFVLGDPAYYHRFGFSAEAAQNFECVYASEAFQVLLVGDEQPGPMRGSVVYPPPFDALTHE